MCRGIMPKANIKNIFGFEFYKKPTNKELIHAIAEYVSESEGIEIS